MNNSNEKFCTKCGKKFIPVGREVICPSCKAAAAEESKKAAVLRAKRASWTGESVPVRISGRASTLIRKYGEENNMPFAAALDALLQSTTFFANLGTEWSTIVPYKSRRMKKSADGEQDVQAAQDVQPQDKEEAWMKQIKRSVLASKASTSKAAKDASKSKATAGKAASKTASKLSRDK